MTPDEMRDQFLLDMKLALVDAQERKWLGRERHGGGTTGVGGETGKNTGNKQGAAEARGHRWCPVTGLPRKEGHGGLQVPKRRAV